MTSPRPRPVLDPDIPAADRDLLRAPSTRLVAAARPAPARPRPGPARLLARALWIPLLALFYGVLPGGWITLFLLASLDEEDLLTGVFRWGRTAVLAMLVLPVVQVTLILLGWEPAAVLVAAAGFTGWTVGIARRLGEPPAARAARVHHGRYLTAGDFDRPAAGLLSRAQRAIDAVQGSRAQRAGLLDGVGNAVALPYQEWEIAEALAEHTRLRREHEAQRPDRLSEPVRALLEPQRRALALSVRSVTERVEALEDYARRVRDLDGAYHEWQVLRRLPEQNARHRDLLARTVRDDLAREEIDRLTGDAQRAETALHDSITSAVQAARAVGRL
ncbi:hypothetical protein [Thermomonospora echinospora]|nr:hypothetical protein [Thermomonospora echinospora]